MELIQLKIRLLDLQQRQITMHTSLGEGGRWQIEMAKLNADIADYMLRKFRAV
jgi:hypothetical protein